MTPLERITARVNRLGDVNAPGTPLPLLTIAEFFDGNDNVGSIGANLPGSPPPSVFRALCEAIAARGDVKDLRVLVSQFDEPDWPFSDAIYVMTAAEPEEVLSWFPKELAPDEVFIRPFDDDAFEPYDVPPGTRPIGCWWD
ncbi:MAG: hypothetical protein WDM86_06020 [Rhizomicrobium sp.]